MLKRAFILVMVGYLPSIQATGAEEKLFPFVLPWDDTSPGLTNFSSWHHRPAGKFGPIRVRDGHFYAQDQRLRFFGVNLCFAATVPAKRDADQLAGRISRFGVNVVRFHHMDTGAFPNGIRDRRGPGTGRIAPEAFDRLDFLIARLKHHGIYSNLNLLVGRPFNREDGLPEEIETLHWKERHIVGFFHEPVLKLQKDYARQLLTHRNTVTGLTYAEDPAVAFVEINNENGLLHSWLGGQVDRLPSVFLDDLKRQWNAWLTRKYQTTAQLRQAWGVKEQQPGPEMFTNADFDRGLEGWNVERHENARAAGTVHAEVPPELPSAGGRSVQIDVTQPSSTSWHVQFNQGRLKIQAESPYTLTFWARADRTLAVSVNCSQAHEPWGNLGLSRPIKLTTKWQSFRFTFLPRAGDDNARISFSDLARQRASVWLAGLSFRPGGVIGLDARERLEDRSVSLLEQARFGERTPAGQRDWLRFLGDTENSYWQTLYRFLKDDLKVQGLVFGTIVGCSTPNLMAPMDAVDTHSYWQHPHFPRRPWDPEDWTVQNRTMVNEEGGTLPGLALRRVVGKPHCVTEYNHSAPNTFGSEGFLLLAAYGGLQDWDAIYAFAYGHGNQWDTRHIGGFFDISQHPTKMATLLPAMAFFVRGDIKPAKELILGNLDKEREVEALRTAHAWNLVHAGSVGVPNQAVLKHRVAILTQDASQPAKMNLPVVKSKEARLISDTGELVWDRSDLEHGVVTVNTPRSKAVIGYGGGKQFDLGGVLFEPGATLQEGWSAVTLTALEGTCTSSPARLLVTATGTAENTGMKWKSPARDSVGRRWGTAPSLVEGIPVRFTLPFSAAQVQAWVLDERGQRQKALEVTADGDKAVLELGLKNNTLWYEVEVKAR